MQAMILAGGYGNRLAEENTVKTKPMVEIGGIPILCHIMKHYSSYGINDFIICCGYKGYVIKEFFSNYFLHKSDVTFHMSDNSTEFHNQRAEPWKVSLIDTGENVMTGGRLLRVKKFLNQEEDFCLTYGDGLSDINISDLINFHKTSKLDATVTAVAPPSRFGALDIKNNIVRKFTEKPKGEGSFINGGFFVLSPRVLDRISGDDTVWEQEPLHSLAADKQLGCFRHTGFWQPMDTLREKEALEKLWSEGNAPWKT